MVRTACDSYVVEMAVRAAPQSPIQQARPVLSYPAFEGRSAPPPRNVTHILRMAVQLDGHFNCRWDNSPVGLWTEVVPIV